MSCCAEEMVSPWEIILGLLVLPFTLIYKLVLYLYSYIIRLFVVKDLGKEFNIIKAYDVSDLIVESKELPRLRVVIHLESGKINMEYKDIYKELLPENKSIFGRVAQIKSVFKTEVPKWVNRFKLIDKEVNKVSKLYEDCRIGKSWFTSRINGYNGRLSDDKFYLSIAYSFNKYSIYLLTEELRVIMYITKDYIEYFTFEGNEKKVLLKSELPKEIMGDDELGKLTEKALEIYKNSLN